MGQTNSSNTDAVEIDFASAVNNKNSNNDNNNNNPLQKIVFIQRILWFLQPKGIIILQPSFFFGTEVKKFIIDIPRVFQLRHVSSHWSETIDYYSSLPSDVVASFCEYLRYFVKMKHSRSEQHAILVRDTLLWISKFAGDSGSVEKFCTCVCEVIYNNPETNRILFGTASVRDAIVALSRYCTNHDSAFSFCNSISHLAVNGNNQILFGTSSVRDALLAVSNNCTTPDSAYSFCTLIIFLVENDNNQILFGTASVRDALFEVSKYCTTADSAKYLCGAILFLNIMYQNDESSKVSNKALFATEAIRDAILSVSVHINVYAGVYFWCRVISLFHEINPTLFCVEETVTSLVNLSKIEMKNQSPQSIYWFFSTGLTLLQSDKQLFDTIEIRNAVERFQKVVNDPEQVEKLENETVGVNKLSNEEYLDKARRLCIEFQKVVSGKSGASSSSADAAAAVRNRRKFDSLFELLLKDFKML